MNLINSNSRFFQLMAILVLGSLLFAGSPAIGQANFDTRESGVDQELSDASQSEAVDPPVAGDSFDWQAYLRHWPWGVGAMALIGLWTVLGFLFNRGPKRRRQAQPLVGKQAAGPAVRGQFRKSTRFQKKSGSSSSKSSAQQGATVVGELLTESDSLPGGASGSSKRSASRRFKTVADQADAVVTEDDFFVSDQDELGSFDDEDSQLSLADSDDDLGFDLDDDGFLLAAESDSYLPADSNIGVTAPPSPSPPPKISDSHVFDNDSLLFDDELPGSESNVEVARASHSGLPMTVTAEAFDQQPEQLTAEVSEADPLRSTGDQRANVEVAELESSGQDLEDSSQHDCVVKKNETLSQELVQLSAAKESLTLQVDQMNEKMEALVSERDQLQHQLQQQALSDQLALETKKQNEFKNQLTTAQQALETARTESADQQSKLEQQLAEARQQLSDHRQQAQEVEANCQNQMQKIDSMRQQVESSNRQHDELAKENDRLQQAVEELTEQLTAAQQSPAVAGIGDDVSQKDVEDLENRFKKRLNAEYVRRKQAEREVAEAERQRNEIAKLLKSTKAELEKQSR